MFKWCIGNNFTECVFIWMALIGHHLQPHHVLRACLLSQAGQGQACLMLGFGRQGLLERLEFRSWFFPGAQLQGSGCQGCPAQRRKELGAWPLEFLWAPLALSQGHGCLTHGPGYLPSGVIKFCIPEFPLLLIGFGILHLLALNSPGKTTVSHYSKGFIHIRLY